MLTIVPSESPAKDIRMTAHSCAEAERRTEAPSQPTVLVVDDSRLMRRLLTIALQQAGYTVVEASDGAEALRIADRPNDELSFSAIVLDIMLPGIDGLTVLRYLREHHPRVPILLISTNQTHLAEGQRAGATAVLSKPFELETFLELVARHRAETPS
jgi:CheY-like chemotaxis protein